MAWTSPRTWVAGEKPTAATLNQHVRDNFNALGAAWTTYTPTLTNITAGNGVLRGGYINPGKLLIVRFLFLAGSTTTYSAGNLGFSLPASLGVNGNYSTIDAIGSGSVDNNSAATRRLVLAVPASAGGSVVNFVYEGGTVSNTTPFTFGTASRITINLTLEVT